MSGKADGPRQNKSYGRPETRRLETWVVGMTVEVSIGSRLVKNFYFEQSEGRSDRGRGGSKISYCSLFRDSHGRETVRNIGGTRPLWKDFVSDRGDTGRRSGGYRGTTRVLFRLRRS